MNSALLRPFAPVQRDVECCLAQHQTLVIKRKSLVNMRMNRSGSPWKLDTGEYVIALRGLPLSEWDRAMVLMLHTRSIYINRGAEVAASNAVTTSR